MTLMEFFGCTFIAFGPPLALFIFTIARDPLRVIVLTASAFFWLLALLLSSILWFAVVPLRTELAFGLVFSVLIQECMRLAFYKLLRKADEGLRKVALMGQETGNARMINNPHTLAYVSGLGFGLMSGAFSLINVLADMSGPGTIGLKGDSSQFFITSAFLTLCFILLHTFWGIVFFSAWDKRKFWQVAIIVALHMLVSGLTFLNGMNPPVYLGTLIPAYVVMLCMMIWAFVSVGGTTRSLKAFFSCKTLDATYDLD
ncbi:gamma-secretase subunit Aph-1-like [Lineus longissimus]|uniref:gamma-secretase subunit Aph-1-like n=1 Tax=Lineus longissimus TaxID=88925 RepID=UPI002B4D83EB